MNRSLSLCVSYIPNVRLGRVLFLVEYLRAHVVERARHLLGAHRGRRRVAGNAQVAHLHLAVFAQKYVASIKIDNMS